MQSELFPNTYKQPNDFGLLERRQSFDNELHQRNQQLSYHDIFYAQRLLEGFTSIDRQPRGFNCESPLTPRSIANRSSFDGTRDASPVMDCSASSSMPTGIVPPCRQLPCRTFICTGTCPYGERCVFIHDPRVQSNRPVFKARLRKSQEDSVIDSFFWHTMPRHEVSGKMDGRNLPAISQHYIVPNPSSATGLARDMRNNVAVYSLWSYFLDFLATDPASMIRLPSWSVPVAVDSIANKHTGRKRLDIFIAMSEGKSGELES